MLSIIRDMLISMLVCYVLSKILNILTDNKSIITIIINSFKISCILIGKIVGCIGILYTTEIIKNDKNIITI